ncbi:MAG: helix-hairpin-helix domain-containing protein [Brevibacterium sp.]|nr:helix-hairpin-helix domain-containing protein [Brevibacterium sp.]MDN5832883.1 helix-hairpin-helix domain-containing protein [Brevibacterium sp.]MDN5875998.1 helix-hairpin-helix domain-containing protein [Brevibacterium sp.]MDN5908424.1 helix-hairpin-helix domain-containing protein [Brevibacterium sp.]MDN6134141.1 helix-hairpin-helix domain-containing protein [Brevibacterium sp.]
MAVSPDDRFAGLINSSAERGGWVPGDVFDSDSEGEEEPVEPRRVRLPILVALAVATIAVLVIAFLIFRPIPQHAASEEHMGSAEGSGTEPDDSVGTDSGDGAGTSAEKEGTQPGQGHAAPGQGQEESDPAQTAAASAAQSAGSGAVIVHVTGAVHRPSVVSLRAGDRVQDAVEAAGGLKEHADAEAINLARVLHDGEQIHIPVRGEEAEPGRADSGSAADSAAGESDGGPSDGAAPGANPGAKVDLNTADLTALQTLPGVGPVTAEAIIAHREEQPFGHVEDLLLVQGIGPKTFESLKDLVVVG